MAWTEKYIVLQTLDEPGIAESFTKNIRDLEVMRLHPTRNETKRMQGAGTEWNTKNRDYLARPWIRGKEH